MTPDEFKTALRAIGWKQSDFARRAGLNPGSVTRWVQGEVPIPEWAAHYLELLQRVDTLHREFVVPPKAGAPSGGE